MDPKPAEGIIRIEGIQPVAYNHFYGGETLVHDEFHPVYAALRTYSCKPDPKNKPHHPSLVVVPISDVYDLFHIESSNVDNLPPVNPGRPVYARVVLMPHVVVQSQDPKTFQEFKLDHPAWLEYTNELEGTFKGLCPIRFSSLEGRCSDGIILMSDANHHRAIRPMVQNIPYAVLFEPHLTGQTEL